MIKIGVIGTGNIGKRHIQSIATLKGEKSLFCYDLFEESLNSLDDFFKDNNISFDKFNKFTNYDRFLEEVDDNTIIIVATTAKGRVDIAKKVIDKNPKAIILEKPVCQTLEEYNSLLDYNKNNVPIYVNFAKRMYDFYKEIHDAFGEKGLMQVNQPKEGIACNGIHNIDLACWIFGAKNFKILSTNLSEPYETKRSGFFDVSGGIKILFDEKNILDLNDNDKDTIDTISFNTENKSFSVYEPLSKMIKVSKEGLKETNITLPYQSQLTSIIIEEIYNKGHTKELPLIEECFLSHKVLFEVLKINEIDINLT